MSPWLFLLFSGMVGVSQTSIKDSEDWQKSLHGAAGLDSTFYGREVSPTNRILETGRLSLETTIKHGKDFRVKFSPQFQADPLNNSPTERYWSELPEGYLQFQENAWTVQLGYNTFNWGVTDGYNPLDIVSARRYQDPLKQEKLGAPALAIKKEVDNITFEAIYIPLQRKSILPGEKSRWLPRQVLTTTSIGDGTQSATLNLPDKLDYRYNEGQEREGALENNFGGRIQINGLLEGLDASIMGFEGAAVTPAVDITASGVLTQLSPRIVIQADPQVGLTPVYYRQRVYGATLVYAAAGMIFRGEAAITRLISRGPDLLGNAEEFVVGIEKPLAVAGRDLTLLLQGSYAQHSVPITNSSTALNRIFDRAILGGARYSASEKLTLTASGLYDTQFHEQLAHLEGTYNVTDAWKLGLAGDKLWGAADTPLGAYDNNERIVVSVKTSF